MELRKVQETGGTYLVSIPKGWADRVGVKRGSLIAIMERPDGSIIMDPQYKLEKEASTVTVAPSPFLDRELTGNYLLGFDTIIINSRTRLQSDVRTTVREAIKRLIGLEIVEEDSGKIVLQCLLEPSSFPPEKIMRREHVFTVSMLKDVMVAFVENDSSLAKTIIERDDEVDRLYFLLVRLLRTVVLNPVLAERLQTSLIDCLDYRLVANYLESIGDQTEEMAKAIMENGHLVVPNELFQKICKLGDISTELLDTSMRGIFSKDLELAVHVLMEAPKVKSLVSEIDKLLTNQSSEAISYISGLAFSLNRICDYSIDIADLVMPIRPS
jgi:phosphate uptake regulator